MTSTVKGYCEYKVREDMYHCESLYRDCYRPQRSSLICVAGTLAVHHPQCHDIRAA